MCEAWSPIERAHLREMLELRAEELAKYLDISPDWAATYLTVKILLEQRHTK
jgi:hypothetical protein